MKVPVFFVCLVLGPVAAAQKSAQAPSWLRYELRPGRQSVISPSVFVLPQDREQALREAGHGALDLLERQQLIVRPKDRIITTINVRRFLDEDGIQQWGDLSFSVSANRSTATVEEMYVHLPGGEIRDIERNTVQIKNSPSAGIFSDAYEVTVPPSGLVPGATAVLVVSVRVRNDDWPLPWSHFFYPRYVLPLERFELTVEWDAGLEPPRIVDDAGVDCELLGDRTRQCTLSQIDPVPMDPDVSSWSDILPHIVVSEPQSWRQIAQRERALVESAVTDDAGVHSEAARIIEGSKGPGETLRRVHRFVADQVRYVGIEHGTGAVVPRPARQILHQRYGDCKDKVVLFLALARAAGLDAEAVLVSTRHCSTEKLISPSWKYFDHMVACVSTPAEVFGETLSPETCLDLTTFGLQTEAIPPWLHGAVALDLSEQSMGPRKLSAPRHGWVMEIESTNEIACGGGLVETVQLRFRGTAAGFMRSFLRSMTEEERRRWGEDTYREVMGDTTEPKLRFAGVDHAEDILEVVSVTEFPWATELTELYDSDAWLNHYAADYFTSNRHHPYLNDGILIESNIRYELCDDTLPKFLGAALDLDSEFGALKRSYRKTGHEVFVNTVLDVPRARITLDKIDRFNRFLRIVLEQSNIWFSYVRTEESK
jgi:hypothetical protein